MSSGFASYRAVLRTRNVSSLICASVVSRLSTSMLELSLLLAVIATYRSYQLAGLALFAHAISLAATAPLGGRLADRLGASRVLVGYILLHLLGYGALAASLHRTAPPTILIAAAALLGLSTPPSSPILRRVWGELLPVPMQSAAYSMDTIINSSTFIVGPLIIGLLAGVVPPAFLVAVGGVAKIVGDSCIAVAIPHIASEPASGYPRVGRSPLRDPKLLALLTVTALDTATLGALQVGSTIWPVGAKVAFLLSSFAAGEVIGGLIRGSRIWPGGISQQLFVLHLATATLLVATALSSPALATPLYFAVGLLSGARDALNQNAVTHFAPTGLRTEAFGWLATFMWVGFGVGTLVSGAMAAHLGKMGVYVIASGAAVSAAVLTRALLWRAVAP